MSQNPALPKLAVFDFTRACNCRGITSKNVSAAMLTSAATTAEELYDAALEYRLQDVIDGKGGFQTGKETGHGFNCTAQACRPLFEEAAAHMAAAHKPARPVIAITDAEPPQPKIGHCGNDCNTCAPKIVTENGCTPSAL